MTSQGGQRFRRRALRRGYKVDEVDVFLDRVEATLNGESPSAPVTAQEAHDIVFRVRFGGYDEWQVDLHLDRVERQLAELEERSAERYERVEQRPVPSQLPPSLPRALPSSAGPALEEPPVFEPTLLSEDRGFAPVRDDYPTQGFPSVVVSTPPAPAPVGPETIPVVVPQSRVGSGEYPRPDDSGFNGVGYDLAGRHGRTDMTTEISVVTGAYTPDEVAKVDALRRTFQPRRFGSGYDPTQVDRLFDAVMAFMTGRSSVAVADGELDPSQFDLVQGGYFEADVDAALKEIRELFRR